MKLLTAGVAAALVLCQATSTAAQAAPRARTSSIALEADAVSFFIGGYSVIANLSLANRLHVALGTGRYEFPEFLLSGDDNFDAAQWEATATSIQVLRAGYRFNGPMRNGPVLGAIAMTQKIHLTSEPLDGETRFRTTSIGLSAGYYIHIGKHFYLYPTAAFTHNSVASGSTSVNGVGYTVEKWTPNGSVHAGWEFAL